MKKNPKTKRREAEVAAEHYAYEVMGCIRTVRAVRTQWQRQDMFSSDVLGKRSDGSLVALQVTAGGNEAVSSRRRKLEKEIWYGSDTVQLLQLVSTENPGKGVRKLWFFRVHIYDYDDYIDELSSRTWTTIPDAVPVPKEWFKKWKDREIRN
jgi:hypothetical protein